MELKAARKIKSAEDSLPVLPSNPWKRQFRRRLLEWFANNARELPWRRTRDPYHIWVSEIMLQQTQVATVIPYFERFLATFPTVAALAEADEHEVLRYWEGLGYYRRARQMHRAAREIVQHHRGQFPAEPEAVRRLPGIGRYTAGAILSIAFDDRQPIVEANTLRLYSRLIAYPGDLQSTTGQRLLWSLAEALLPRQRVGIFNQALMELGSLVCMPRAPACERCPVAALCPTQRDGLQQVIPRPKSKPRIEQVRQAAVVVHHRGKVLLRRQQEAERWAGLWDFPRFTVETAEPTELFRQLSAHVTRQTGVGIASLAPVATLKHGVTRFRITLDCYAAPALPGRRRSSAEQRWLKPEELSGYPLSVTGRKLAAIVQTREF